MVSVDSKRKALELAKIDKEIATCPICPIDKIGKPVPGEGNPDANIAFIGEAPGKTEAETGRPFVGRSGKLLRANIVRIGLKENEVYITSPVKYLPKRGTPTPADIAHGREHLMKQLDVIDPKIVVLMGRVAAEGVLQEKVSVTKFHGKSTQKGGRIYFFMYHPAAAIRFQKFKKTFEEDFDTLKQTLQAKADQPLAESSKS